MMASQEAVCPSLSRFSKSSWAIILNARSAFPCLATFANSSASFSAGLLAVVISGPTEPEIKPVLLELAGLLEAALFAMGAFGTAGSLARKAVVIDDLRFVISAAVIPPTKARAAAPTAIHNPFGFLTDVRAAVTGFDEPVEG